MTSSRTSRISALLFILILWSAAGAASAAQGPLIKMWYGDQESFGALGQPQQFVNLLGNVSDPSGVKMLSYSLNGGAPETLAIGPATVPSSPESWTCFAKQIKREASAELGIREDIMKYPRRVYYPGDFNLEIDTSRLHDGANTVVLRAIGNNGAVTTLPVAVNFTSNRVWPLPYSVVWNQGGNFADKVQIVDGKWGLTPEGLRTLAPGYDRVFVLGDLTWKSYEITVPITIHAIDRAPAKNEVSTGPGLMIDMHWHGHSFNPVGPCLCHQPRCGYHPTGADAMYQFNEAQFAIGSTNGLVDSGGPRFLKLETPYIWKMRAETDPGGKVTHYWFKVWRQGDPEPPHWYLSGTTIAPNLNRGSIAIVAHHVDATFGNISVTPGRFSAQQASIEPGATKAEQQEIAPKKSAND